jgi:hypothetical protein
VIPRRRLFPFIFGHEFLFWVLFGVLLVSAGPFAYARLDLVPGGRYTSARGAGMGDAVLPMGDDAATGLYQNPAALGRIRKPELELFNFSLYGNNGLWASPTTAYNIFSLGSYNPTLQASPGTFAGAGGAYVGTFAMRGLAVGVLAQSNVGAVANADGTLNYRSLFQVIPSIGVGFRLFNGVLRFGYSLQWVHEAVGDVKNETPSSAGYTNGIAQGSAFSHTLGAALVLPTIMLPTFDVVVRNALNSVYSTSTFLHLSQNPTGAPATEQMTVDLAFSLHPKVGQGATFNLVLVDRDMMNVSGMTFIGHFALGAELNIRERIFIRGGWGSGYPAAGLGLRSTRGAELSFSWYTEELGSGYLSQGDTKFLMQYRMKSF